MTEIPATIQRLYEELDAERANLRYHLAEKAAGSFLEDAEIDHSRKEIERIEAALAAREA